MSTAALRDRSVVPRSNVLQDDARYSICAQDLGDILCGLGLTDGDLKLSLDWAMAIQSRENNTWRAEKQKKEKEN